MTENAKAVQREPLVRIVKRGEISAKKAWLIRALAALGAVLTGAPLILSLGHNPVAVYGQMVVGAVGSKIALVETIKIAIPLLGAAIAIAPAFKMKFWNIGAEGQIMAGAIAASYFALFYSQSLPRPLLLAVMMAAALAAGALWGVIPALFKAKWGTNETLFTLMLNYIILGFEQYLQNGPWKRPSSGGFPKIAMFDEAARLPRLFGVHIGWIFVLLLVVGMTIYLRRSKQGYEIAVVGESERTARYAGMNVSRIIVRTMLISGAIAGLVGFLQVSGANYTLTENTAGGIGFTAITVAWLAKLNPVVMVFIAALLAILQKGSGRIQTEFLIPASAAEVLTGIILFFMLGCEFFINYRLVLRGKEQKRG